MTNQQPIDRERSKFQGKMFFAIHKVNPMVWLNPVVYPKLERLFEKHQSILMMKAYKEQGEPEMLDFIDNYILLSEVNQTYQPKINTSTGEVRT